jgi:competence protein ComEC
MLFYLRTEVYDERLSWLWAGLVLLYVLLWRIISPENHWKWRSVLAIVSLSSLFIAGWLIAHQRTESLQTHHLLHQNDSITHYQAIIVSEGQEKARSYRAEAEARAIRQNGNWKPCEGKILLYLEKMAPRTAYGDLLLIKGKPALVALPSNPGEFNNRQYLRDQQIFHQHYLRTSDFVLIGHTEPNPIMTYAIRVRRSAEAALKNAIGAKREYAIANAIILGVSQDIDQDTKSAYAASGAMHVLSVSGLHVGILFLLLDLMLGWIKKIRYGPVLYATVIVLLLWFYAFITALSPSVLRAVTMFSFVVVAQASRRQSNIYNTLAISAFGLLCVDPYYLLSVGFQLSYLAVAGILWFTPGLTRLLEVPDPYAEYRTGKFWKKLKSRTDLEKLIRSLWHKALEWLWTATCVSVAAQIATFPLGLYYFHQFPNYFWLANPAVLLLSAWILPLGLITLALSLITGCFSGLSAGVAISGYLLKGALWLLNSAVLLTEKLPYALMSGIHISFSQMLLLYGFLLSIIALFEFRRFRYVWLSFGLALVLAGIAWGRVWEQHNQRMIVLHNIRQHSVISMIEGNRAHLLADSAFYQDPSLFRYHLADFWGKSGIAESERLVWGHLENKLAWKDFKFFSLLVCQGKTFLFISAPPEDGLPYPALPDVDYVVLQNGAVSNLSTWVKASKVRNLVLESSNKPFVRHRLMQQAASLGIPCHDLSSQGALLVE